MSSKSTRSPHARPIFACTAALLLSCCAASPASARKPQAAKEVIEIELSQSGDGGKSLSFLVPIDGRIAGWTELFGEQHFCQFDADVHENSRLRLRVSCARSRKTGQRSDLNFQAAPTLELGAPTVIGELALGNGERLQVIATRR